MQLFNRYVSPRGLTVFHSSRELLIRLLQAAGAASIIIAILYVLIPSLAIGNGIFVSSLVIFLIAIIAWRLLFNRLAYASHLEERVLVVGSGPTARMVARQIQSQHDFGYRVVGFINDQARGFGALNPGTLGTAEEIPRIVRD